MQRTTDIEKLKNGLPFIWGKLIDIQTIGEYSIVYYHPWIVDNGNIKTGFPNLGKLFYHGYVLGKDTSNSWESLDEALVGCIAYNREGPNHKADFYFMKMIKSLPTGE